MAKNVRLESFPSFVTTTGVPTITSVSSSTSMGSVRINASAGNQPAKKVSSEVERAVFAHIQAVRALGRNEINTFEIAQALSLSPETVVMAVARLRDKGVRIAQ